MWESSRWNSGQVKVGWNILQLEGVKWTEGRQVETKSITVAAEDSCGLFGGGVSYVCVSACADVCTRVQLLREVRRGCLTLWSWR